MSPPWMPFYVADYLADTGHLSAPEHGAYLLLIMHYWQKGGLPTDDRQLARVARTSDRAWSAMRPTIQAFFTAEWRHARVERELAKSEEKTSRRSAAGKAGGYRKHRSSNKGSNATSNALASSSQPQSSNEDTSLRSVAARPQKPKSIRSRIDENAQPSDADSEHAKSVGMSAEVFRFEWNRFRDHHLKVASSFASWAAAWRTWCANWLERSSRQARAGPRQSNRDMLAALCHADETDPFDDSRFDANRSAQASKPTDTGGSGFVGRLPFEDRPRAGREKLVDL